VFSYLKVFLTNWQSSPSRCISYQWWQHHIPILWVLIILFVSLILKAFSVTDNPGAWFLHWCALDSQISVVALICLFSQSYRLASWGWSCGRIRRGTRGQCWGSSIPDYSSGLERSLSWVRWPCSYGPVVVSKLSGFPVPLKVIQFILLIHSII